MRRADIVSIEHNGFKGLNKSIRSQLLKCRNHRDEIEKWRATLTEPERLRYNHPNTVLRKWKLRAAHTTTKRKSRNAELKESVQRLEDENFALQQRIRTGAVDEPQMPQLPSPGPDIALFLPPEMPSDALGLLKSDLHRLHERYGLRCVWKPGIQTSGDGGDADLARLPRSNRDGPK